MGARMPRLRLRILWRICVTVALSTLFSLSPAGTILHRAARPSPPAVYASPTDGFGQLLLHPVRSAHQAVCGSPNQNFESCPPYALTAVGGGVSNLSWTNVTASVSPVPFDLSTASLAFDPATGTFVAVSPDYPANGSAGVEDTWILADGGWQLASPLSSPEALSDVEIVGDPALGGVLLFGGDDYYLGAGFLNETWLYRNSTWENVSGWSAAAPSARDLEAMAYDPAAHGVLLFGGVAWTTLAYLHDTWMFSSTGWSEVAPSSNESPPGLWSPGLGSDPSSDSMVLYGGWEPGAASNETWTFQNGSWTNETGRTGQGPPALSSATLVPFNSMNGTVLYGGATSAGGASNATWIYSHGSWTNETSAVDVNGPSPGVPSLDQSTLFAYDPASEIALLDAAQYGLWMLGPPIAVLPNAAHYEVDVGVQLKIGATVLGVAKTYARNYSGLPFGCTTANVTELNCTPTTPGDYRVYLNASAPGFGQGSAIVWVNVSADPTIRSFAGAPSTITLGNATRFNVTLSGGLPPFRYAYAPLPPGCVSVSSATLDCRPTLAGTYPINVSVTDADGLQARAATILVVNPRPTLISFLVSRPVLEVGDPLQLNTTLRGGTPPFAFSYTGLPPGCASANLPQISCTPSGPGAFTPVVTATDAFGWTVSSTASVSVYPHLNISASRIAPATTDVGRPVAIDGVASGGWGQVTFSVTGFPGTCPLNGGQLATCYPATTGVFEVVVTASDSLGDLSSIRVYLTVNPDPSFAAITYINRTTVGATVRYSAALAGGTPPYTIVWSFGTGSSATGQNASYAFPSSGNFSVRVTATDAAGFELSQVLPVQVTNASPAPVNPSGTSGFAVPPWAWVAIAAVAASGIAVGWIARTQRRTRPPQGSDGTNEPGADPTSAPGEEDEREGPSDGAQRTDRASTLSATNPSP